MLFRYNKKATSRIFGRLLFCCQWRSHNFTK